ncbi:MAG: hypothetical protein GY953_01695 [bacterium]|nr:hypothetical protein [bacterium]
MRIDCLGESARLHVRSGEETVALNVADPGKVLLKNVSSVTFQFSCGELEPRPVAVEHSAGEVTAIEFR